MANPVCILAHCGIVVFGIIFVVTCKIAVDAGGDAKDLEDELASLNEAKSARCLLSRRPGTPNKWETQLKLKTGRARWTSCECAVTVDYTSADDSKGSVAGTVFAGVDWTSKRDIHAWCDDTLSEEWLNIQIQGKWVRYEHNSREHTGDPDLWADAQRKEPGFACGTRQVVMAQDMQCSEGCPDGDKKGAANSMTWKNEPYGCGDAPLKDGGEAECSVDAGGQVRLGSVESLKRQTQKMLDEAQTTKSTMIPIACVCGLLACGLYGFTKYLEKKKKKSYEERAGTDNAVLQAMENEEQGAVAPSHGKANEDDKKAPDPPGDPWKSEIQGNHGSPMIPVKPTGDAPSLPVAFATQVAPADDDERVIETATGA